MANKQTAEFAGEPSALSEEVRAAGMDKLADKLEVHTAIHNAVHADENGHRPLEDDELRAQRKHGLDVEELKAAQDIEYGTYVAREDIFHGSALAFPEGWPVPVSNVERHGYDQLGLVTRVADRGPGKARAVKQTAAAKAEQEGAAQ